MIRHTKAPQVLRLLGLRWTCVQNALAIFGPSGILKRLINNMGRIIAHTNFHIASIAPTGTSNGRVTAWHRINIKNPGSDRAHCQPGPRNPKRGDYKGERGVPRTYRSSGKRGEICLKMRNL